MSLESLQRSIDDSLAHASTLSRSLFGGNSWTAEEVQAFANTGGAMTIATVDRAGRPHAAPVVGGRADGVLCFSASKGSAMLRHIVANDAIAFTIAGVGHNTLGQGRAVRMGAASELRELATILGADAHLSRLVVNPWDGDIYSIELTRIFAN